MLSGRWQNCNRTEQKWQNCDTQLYISFFSFSAFPFIPPKVALTVVPNRSQFFKFESFSVSCEEEEESGWRVMKRTQDGEVSGMSPLPPHQRDCFPFYPWTLPGRYIHVRPPAPSRLRSLPPTVERTGVKLDWAKPATWSTSLSPVSDPEPSTEEHTSCLFMWCKRHQFNQKFSLRLLIFHWQYKNLN